MLKLTAKQVKERKWLLKEADKLLNHLPKVKRRETKAEKLEFAKKQKKRIKERKNQQGSMK